MAAALNPSAKSWDIAGVGPHPWEQALGLPAGCAAAAAYLTSLSGSEPVVLCAPASASSACLILAAVWAPRSVVLLSPQDPPQAQAKRLAQLPESPQHWLGVSPLPGMQHHPLPELPHELVASPGERLPSQQDPGHIAWIIFGSGSSGRHRAIALRQGQLRFAAQAQAQHLRLGPGEHWLCCLPLHHIGGCMAILRSLLAGAGVRLQQGFCPQALAADLQHCRGTSLVPTMAQRLLQQETKWSHAPLILLGGAWTGAELCQGLRLAGAVPLRCWGATETAAMACCQHPDQAPDGDENSCGPALAGYQLRIGTNQQLMVRGAGVASTAWQDGQAIALCDSNGWLESGDAASLDASGRVSIFGRLDSAFTSGGETVFVEDIEAQLILHPTVTAACVVAVRDQQWGQRAAAWIDCPNASDHSIADLEQWCRQHLRPAQRPLQWHVAPLPLLSNGKIDRQEVQRFFTPS